MLKTKLLGATAAAELLAIEDVFSTYLYTGNSSTQTITNGIDLAGEGGLVWIKVRNVADSHALLDTERGAGFELWSNSTNGNINASGKNFSFLGTGFSMNTADGQYNNSSNTYASWTFRKTPRFFDVVTYTGTGSARTVNHNLGSVPGCIIVKQTGGTTNWSVYHRSMDASAPENYYMPLNLTDARIGPGASQWGSTAPTDTQFTVGTGTNTNASGGTYVAYLFAHDPLGPSGDGSDGMIACGSYTGNGSATGPVVSLGWEPQWVLVKRTDNTSLWTLSDNMRGQPVDGATAILYPNAPDAEGAATTAVSPNATGFQVMSAGTTFNASGGTYIYIAIRRGPMREPTSGTEVFFMDTYGSTGDGKAPAFRSSAPIDMAIYTDTVNGLNKINTSRLTQKAYLMTDNTTAETSNSPLAYDYQNGYHSGTTTFSPYFSWMFRRAPGFFDVVAYSGDSTSNRAIPHNLGVQPELTIVKVRNAADNWFVTKPEWVSSAQGLRLNFASALGSGQSWLTGVSDPTNTNFYVSSNSAANGSGYNYIMYHFATLSGISKVGSYTGNGSSQTINCSFTGGARFVLIKRTDSTGDWYVWDTARGIVSGNDPHLSLNTTAAEVTSDDSIDPDSSGFIVNQDAATNVNVSSATYIYLAIA